MQPGSIVELTKNLKGIDFDRVREKTPSLAKQTPYIIQDGPKMQEWKNQFGRKGIVHAILLDEFPEIWFNMSYFSEVQAPDELSAEEVVKSCMPHMIAVAI